MVPGGFGSNSGVKEKFSNAQGISDRFLHKRASREFKRNLLGLKGLRKFQGSLRRFQGISREFKGSLRGFRMVSMRSLNTLVDLMTHTRSSFKDP